MCRPTRETTHLTGSEKFDNRAYRRDPSDISELTCIISASISVSIICPTLIYFFSAIRKMQSPTRESSIQSPRHLRKRKRRTFSCLQCRRRKLKCDQVQPSCSRCKGQDIECVFENPTINNKPTEAKNPISTQPHADTPASLNNIITPPQGQYANAASIRNTNLEALQSEGTWGLLGDQAASSLIRERPAVMSDSLHLLEPPKPLKTENIIFRGKNFRTQYYGGSNPTSLIGDVRTSIHFFEFGIAH